MITAYHGVTLAAGRSIPRSRRIGRTDLVIVNFTVTLHVLCEFSSFRISVTLCSWNKMHWKLMRLCMLPFSFKPARKNKKIPPWALYRAVSYPLLHMDKNNTYVFIERYWWWLLMIQPSDTQSDCHPWSQQNPKSNKFCEYFKYFKSLFNTELRTVGWTDTMFGTSCFIF